MIINTGQMCIVNYPGSPRMRDLKCPDWEEICRRSSLQKKKKNQKTYGASRDNFFVSYSN